MSYTEGIRHQQLMVAITRLSAAIEKLASVLEVKPETTLKLQTEETKLKGLFLK